MDRKDAVQGGAEQMQAGREMDALVHERVMGKRVGPSGMPVYDAESPHPVMWIRGGVGAPLSMSPDGPPPPYSTNIAAAWEVVEKMADMGKVFIVKADGLRDGTFNPRFTVFCDNRPVQHSQSAPLAICRAALAALQATPTPPEQGR